MADKYQEAILNAISYLVDNKISSIDRDKTITATIVTVNNALTGEYKVSYNGGTITAYAQDGTSYTRDSTVFVLVPEGNFSKKKTILGLATSTSADSNVSFVSSLMNDYNKLGENCLSSSSSDGKKTRWGLCSYLKEDYVLLYQHGHEDSSFITVNDEDFATYISQAEALLLQGNFQTALPHAHRTTSSGKYGVSFTLAFKDGDEQIRKYSRKNIARIAVADNDFEISDTDFDLDLTNAKHLAFIKQFLLTKMEIDSLWEVKNITNIRSLLSGVEDMTKKPSELGISIDAYKTAINAAIAAYDRYTAGSTGSYNDYEVSNASAAATANLLAHCIEYVQDNYPDNLADKIHCTNFLLVLRENDTSYKSNTALATLLDDFISDLELSTSETFADNIVDNLTPRVKYISYTVDSTNMLGSPMNYSSVTTQYNIYQIDSANFLYIDSILLFSQDFVQKDDTTHAYSGSTKNNNIFFSDFAAYGLKTISSTNGDYSLRLATPQGSIFKTLSNKSADAKTVVGKLTKLQTDLSDTTSFSWFSKDDRISSTSEKYRVTAGSGWRYLEDKGSTKVLTLLPSENKAYENKYLCVANYKDTMILKTDFTIYNEACKREILVESNFPDNEFSFDRGSPILTCTIDGKSSGFEDGKDKNHHDDSLFSFYWSVTDVNGNVTTLSKTVEQLKEEYREAMKADGTPYSTLMSLQNQMTLLEGVTWEKNVLTYPVKQIDSLATFSCSVFLRDEDGDDEYFIGSASLTLKNTTIADPVDYTIRITNGDQVFQYSESGVTPASERNTDPQKILPLQCRFFDKNGLEVNTSTYSVRWRVPLSDTMIVTPTEGMKTNPATMLDEWYVATPYPLVIKESYDYQATHNQVTCIVTYQGEEYSQDTSLTFNKIGDNGTNGTDVVAKISPKSSPQGGLFALEIVEGVAKDDDTFEGRLVTTNMGLLKDNPLTFNLYRRSEALNPPSVTWSVAPKSAKARNLTVNNSGVLGWEFSNSDGTTMENLIVKATTTFDASVAIDGSSQATADNTSATSSRQTYNAFYPVPIINHGQKKTLYVKILRDETLKQVLYNADGRNPMYNKKQGVCIEVTDESGKPIDGKVIWTVRGGKLKNDMTSTLRLSEVEEGNFNEGSLEVEQTSDSGTFRVYAIPADTYSGEYMNQVIEGRIYVDGSLGCTVTVPVYLSLNSYGLASLNAWDGNHIEINEDGNYILAPQIGAGYKGQDPNDSNVNNVFTGIVMGQAKTYDSDVTSTGLLGYSGGKQSIWLDAESGKAVFGLPSNAASQENAFNEGRIELVPGGNSQIGNWTIGSNALYSARRLAYYTTSDYPITEEKYSSEEKAIAHANLLAKVTKVVDDDGTITYITSDKNSFSSEVDAEMHAAELGKIEEHWAGAKNNKDYTIANSMNLIENNSLSKEYESEKVNEASVAIPHDMQGAILSAFPSYLSIKGKPLTTKNSDIQFNAAGCTIGEGDSLELEIDPNKSNIFSLYRHTDYKEDEETGGILYDKDGKPQHGDWKRKALVGIDSQGRFFTNSLQDGKASMTIGPVGAFNKPATSNTYIGSNFGSDSYSILKFFTEAKKPSDGRTTYLTTGFDVSKEYPHHLNLYGRTVSLYSNSSTSNKDLGFGKTLSDTSGHYMKLTDDSVKLGHSFFYADSTSNEATVREDYLDISASTSSNAKNMLRLDSASTEVVLKRPLNVTIGTNPGKYSSADVKLSGSANTSIGKGYTLTTKGSKDKANGYGITLSYAPVPNTKADGASKIAGYDSSLVLGDDIVLKKKTSATEKLDGITYDNRENVLTVDQSGNTTYSSYGGFHINTWSSAAAGSLPASIMAGGEGGLFLGASPANSTVNSEDMKYFKIGDFSTNNQVNIMADNNSAYLYLHSAQANQGQFVLSGGGCLIQSVVAENKYTYTDENGKEQTGNCPVTGNQLSPGIMTQWGNFMGKSSDSSDEPSLGWSSNEHVGIRCWSNLLAHDFIFGKKDTGIDENYAYSGSYYSVDDKHLREVLNKIYAALNDLGDRIDKFKKVYNGHTHDMSHTHSVTYSKTTGVSSSLNTTKAKVLAGTLWESKGYLNSINVTLGSITSQSSTMGYLLKTNDSIEINNPTGVTSSPTNQNTLVTSSYPNTSSTGGVSASYND